MTPPRNAPTMPPARAPGVGPAVVGLAVGDGARVLGVGLAVVGLAVGDGVKEDDGAVPEEVVVLDELEVDFVSTLVKVDDKGVPAVEFGSTFGDVDTGELSLALGSTLVMADATDPLSSLTLVGLDCVSSTTAALGSGILSKKAQALL